MMNWHIVTSADFAAGVKHDENLYFLSDTHEIYRGEVPFTESIILYTELPATGIAVNRLYVNSTTLEGKVYDGTSWKTVIKPITDTVTAEGTDPVSGKAVAAYVAAEIAKITSSGEVVSALSWDSADHLLTVTKGSNETETILFEGLGVKLEYAADTGVLKLVDTSNNVLSSINLALEKFVTAGEYDPEKKSIILYFDAGKTESVEIPVGDLIDTYTAEGSNSLNLSVENNVIKGSVKISTADGNNTIIVKEDGLYVAPVDISNKVDKVSGGVQGDIAILTADGGIADSGKTFEDIVPNSHVYIGSTFEEAVTGKTPVKNDVVVVREQIGTSDKYQRTAYIYDGEAWQKMDESYNAENVYFGSDLMTTSAIGNITLTNGQATIAATGKNLKQVWDSIFIKEKNPTITQPSVSISAPNNKAYEVGTTVTPSYTATLNPGKYEFNENGGATGITASSWSVTDTASHTATTNTGSFDAFVVADDTNYKITATANYAESSIVPVTNTGNEYSAGKIAAGSKSATSSAITGYRKGFYGCVTSKDEITSDIIRGLAGKTTSAPKAGNVWTVPVTVGALRVIIAYPATVREVNSILDVNGMNAEIKTSFTSTQIDVEGADGYTAIPYRVYYIDFASANDTANNYKVTL